MTEDENPPSISLPDATQRMEALIQGICQTVWLDQGVDDTVRDDLANQLVQLIRLHASLASHNLEGRFRRAWNVHHFTYPFHLLVLMHAHLPQIEEVFNLYPPAIKIPMVSGPHDREEGDPMIGHSSLQYACAIFAQEGVIEFLAESCPAATRIKGRDFFDPFINPTPLEVLLTSRTHQFKPVDMTVFQALYDRTPGPIDLESLLRTACSRDRVNLNAGNDGDLFDFLARKHPDLLVSTGGGECYTPMDYLILYHEETGLASPERVQELVELNPDCLFSGDPEDWDDLRLWDVVLGYDGDGNRGIVPFQPVTAAILIENWMKSGKTLDFYVSCDCNPTTEAISIALGFWQTIEMLELCRSRRSSRPQRILNALSTAPRIALKSIRIDIQMDSWAGLLLSLDHFLQSSAASGLEALMLDGENCEGMFELFEFFGEDPFLEAVARSGIQQLELNKYSITCSSVVWKMSREGNLKWLTHIVDAPSKRIPAPPAGVAVDAHLNPGVDAHCLEQMVISPGATVPVDFEETIVSMLLAGHVKTLSFSLNEIIQDEDSFWDAVHASKSSLRLWIHGKPEDTVVMLAEALQDHNTTLQEVIWKNEWNKAGILDCNHFLKVKHFALSNRFGRGLAWHKDTKIDGLVHLLWSVTEDQFTDDWGARYDLTARLVDDHTKTRLHYELLRKAPAFFAFVNSQALSQGD